MTPANSDKNLNIYVKTPTTVRSNRCYGGAVRTDSKKAYLAGYDSDQVDLSPDHSDLNCEACAG